MMTLPGKMSLMLLILGLCGHGALRAEQVVFTLNGSQSSLTFSGTIDIDDLSTAEGDQTNAIFPEQSFVSQSQGNLIEGYTGTVTVNLLDTIEFVSAAMDSNTGGSTAPDEFLNPGYVTSPSDYGVQTTYSVPPVNTFTIYISYRDILFGVQSSPLALTSGSFDASSLVLFPQGTIDFTALPTNQIGDQRSSANIALDYTGTDGVTPRDDPNNVGSATGNLVVSGTTATLTFPLQFDYDETNSNGDNLSYRLAGTIVATATLTQAPFEPTLYANYYGLTGNDALPGSDKDGDGQDNRAEMAFGSNPDDASSKGNIYLQFFDDNGDTAVAITFPVRTGGSVAGGDYEAGSITYAPRSGSLPNAVSSTLIEVTPALTAGLPALTGPYEYKTFRISGTSPTRAFFQVGIQ